MAEKRDLLLEIGTEELPPGILPNLARALEQGVLDGLDKAGLTHGASRHYATPRRLAVQVVDVATAQPEQRLERRGPALKAAFDKQGQPTRAAEGFARSCGVEVNQLDRVETDKGAWLVHVHTEPGRQSMDLLPEVVAAALDSLPIPKRMRWGTGSDEFSRPVRWIVLLLGDRVIPAEFFGLPSGAITRGHRFHHPEPLKIDQPADYVERLRDAYVIADFAERRYLIRNQVEALAQEAGGRAVLDSTLLDEVTALVEWPVALLGRFEERFLAVPPEVLISTMQDNQRYFPVLDATGALLPCFITVANLASRDPEQVRAGNERVIRPRFSDAEFFWNQDRKHALVDRVPQLASVVFQQQLGTVLEKSCRVQLLAGYIASQLSADEMLAQRAALLGKCDLLTDMVQEFPELQGTMGRYYARHDGEPEEVALALEEQYQPRYAGDRIPETPTGRILALAERLDTLIGIFAIGQVPTGGKDPFALRRSALGVIRILIEGRLDLDVEQLLQQAASAYVDSAVDGMAVVPAVLDFILERMRGYYLDRSISADVFEAVAAARPMRLLDFEQRIQAVTTFNTLPEAASLATANKRIRNILRKSGDSDEAAAPLRRELMQEPAEQALADELDRLAASVQRLTHAGDYPSALRVLAGLREPVDRFFDDVMVMADDPSIRANRLALLGRLSGLFDGIADFSRLQA